MEKLMIINPSEFGLETKKASELMPGGFITLTGYTDEIAEIEYVDLEEDGTVAIRTNDGRGKYLKTWKSVKVYTIEVL